MNILEVKQLTKTYKDKVAVRNLNLTVRSGMVYGLLGANGAGKSTSIECILGTKKSDSGEVKLCGLNPKRDRKQLFEQVGVQFQEANYQAEIKVDELCEETSCIYSDPEDWRSLLKQFGLAGKEKNLVKTLSGGERQKLFIVLALIPNPEVVFLDELTTGLDAKARRSVWKTLEKLKQKGLTIILTSHFMDEVEELCDEICILKKGETVFKGTVEEAKRITTCEKFEDAYLQLSDDDADEDEEDAE